MIQRLFATGIIAGLIAGLAITGFQRLYVQPLIVAAELFERQAQKANPQPDTHKAPLVKDHHDKGVAPGEGGMRIIYTLLANLIMAVGYGLLLAAGLTLKGDAVGVQRGAIWGMAGFAAFTLIPAIGLPPEVPGLAAADLLARQAWWWFAAAASVVALGMIAFGPNAGWKLLGLAVIALPFVIGAPQPVPGANAASNLPPDLAARFVTATLGAGLVFWALLGGIAGFVFDRFKLPAAAGEPATGT
jgi:cobalt transporter subunit CbtA